MQYKKSLFILYVLASLILSTSAFADQWGDYEYTVSGSTVTITGYTGAGGDVVIPGVINDMPVVAIGAEAFSGLTTLTSVTIPASVSAIQGSCAGSFPFTISSPPPTDVEYEAITPSSYYEFDTSNYIYYFANDGSFHNCPNLTAVYFQGNAPTIKFTYPDYLYFNIAGTVDYIAAFYGSSPAVYHTAEATGFTTPWCPGEISTWDYSYTGTCYPTAVFDPTAP